MPVQNLHLFVLVRTEIQVNVWLLIVLCSGGSSTRFHAKLDKFHPERYASSLVLLCLVLNKQLTLETVQDADEAVFLGLQIAGGQVLLPILLVTVLLSPTVKRHSVFSSFCISWICSSIAFSLLCVHGSSYGHSYRLIICKHRLYNERSSNDDLSLDPTYNECLIQASLLNGVQAWYTHSFYVHCARLNDRS